MQVKVRDKCPVCGGTGHEVHPFWVEYEQDGEPKGMSPDDYARHVYGLDEPPPYEVECLSCMGTGEVEKWLELEDLAKALKEVMK